METLFIWMERYLLLTLLAFAGNVLLPKGAAGASAKRAFSLLLLLHAAGPLVLFSGG